MKYILIIFSFLFLVSGSDAQNMISNGDFQDVDNQCSSTGKDAFTQGCVAYWSASHGTPDANYTSQFGAYAFYGFSSDDCFWGERSEGAFYTFPDQGIIPGKTYRLEFDMEGKGAGRLEMRLSNDLQSFTDQVNEGGIQLHCESWRAVPDVPSEKIAEVSNYIPGAREHHSFTFTVDNCYTQLWILPRADASFSVDNITLVEDCQQEQFYQNTSNLPAITKVDDRIVAGSDVIAGQTQGPVVVKSGQHVIFQAGNEIDIRPEFIVEEGATFETILAPCSGTPGMPEYSELSIQVDHLGCQYRLFPVFDCSHSGKSFSREWGHDLPRATAVYVSPLSTTVYSLKMTDQDGNIYIGNVELPPLSLSINQQKSPCGFQLSVCQSANLSYRWFWAEQPGTNETHLGNQSSIEVFPVQPTRYYVEVTDNISGEKVLLSHLVHPQPLTITSDQKCSMPITLTASYCNIPQLDFTWSGSSDKDNQIAVNPSSAYTQSLTVTDNITGKTVSKSIPVRPVYGFRLNTAAGEKEVYPRNSFTPNGDGANDIWFVEEENLHKKDTYAYSAYGYRLIIENRWGNSVYERSELRGHPGFKERDIYWDGKNNNGNMLPSATYYYILYLHRCDGTKSFNGWVQMEGATSKLSYEGYEDNGADKETPVASNAIYPNPTSGNITISSAGDFSAYLVDLKGNIVKTAENEHKIASFDLSGLSSGIYTVKIVTEHGVTFEKITFQP